MDISKATLDWAVFDGKTARRPGILLQSQSENSEAGIKATLKLTEQANLVNSTRQRQLIKNCQASLTSITNDLKVTDNQIDELIQNDSRLKELFGWITSVPGVGSVTATEVLVATDEVKAISDPKKRAASAVRLPCWRCSL